MQDLKILLGKVIQRRNFLHETMMITFALKMISYSGYFVEAY